MISLLSTHPILVIQACLVAWIAVELSRALYNVFFHPLRHFPGPAAAGASNLWKMYMEVVRQESPAHLLVELHKQYGDVVRIRPNELHFSSPEAFHDIYNPKLRWDKDPVQYQSVGANQSTVAQITYANAKHRKDILKPLFSRRSVLGFQELIRRKMDHLTHVLAQRNLEGKSSNMLMAFRCMVLDTATEFCFASTFDALSTPDFRPPLLVAMNRALPAFAALKHFPVLRKVALALPSWVVRRLDWDAAGLAETHETLRHQVRTIMAHPETLQSKPHATVYHRLLDPANQKEGYRAVDATMLFDEANTLIFEATHTVADPATLAMFHIIRNPTLHQKLRAEIVAAWPDLQRGREPSLEELEALPLLAATVKETLRIAGIASPLYRITPPQGAYIGRHAVPGGTTVGMSIYHLHRNAEIFADPHAFQPERWLADKEAVAALERNFAPFSRGPRSCVASNLATSELYVLLSSMVRCFDMQLDGTTEADMAWRDCLVPHFPGRHLHLWCKPVDK